MGVLLQPQSWHINVFLACGLTSSTQPVLLTIFLIKRHEIWCVPNANHTLWASRVLSQPPSLLHALLLKSENISHFRMSGLICWCLETWISSELPWVKLGFNRQATEYLLSHIWDCHYRAEAQAKGNRKGMWLSGVESTQGNREEQGDKMEGKINSEDPVFVSGRHVSVGSKNNLW